MLSPVPVHLLVGSCKANLHQTWWMDGARAREEPIKFWDSSRSFTMNLISFSLKSGVCCLTLDFEEVCASLTDVLVIYKLQVMRKNNKNL